MSSEERQTRYWCHVCNAEVSIYMAPDPTCQQCNEQFIEELQSDDDPRAFLSGTDNEEARNGHVHLPGGGAAHFFSYSPSTGRLRNLNQGDMGDDMFQYFTPRRQQEQHQQTEEEEEERGEGGGGRPRQTDTNETPSPLGNFVQSILTNMLGSQVDMENTNENENRPMIFLGNMVDGNMRFEPMPGRDMPGSMPRNSENEDTEQNEGANGQEFRGNSIASILQFLSAMTGAPIDGGLVGNPNDYVFSQTALDNIITQLMEQTSGASAPPPAPEQVIETLPKRPLTDKEKSQETDCAVCKDHFELDEQVIELPCQHIFHDDCIKPWLKLNGTCPVCRHSVLPEQESNQNQGDNNQGDNNGNQDNNSSQDNNSNDNNNTEHTQQTDNNNNDRENTNNSTPSTTTFTFVSGNFPGANNNNNNNNNNSWPLNLSSTFPWVNQLNRSQSNSPSTTQHHEDDLDLD